MNKYEVEIEVNYIYGIEADEEQGARMIAQMNVDENAAYLERVITSIYVEKMEPGNTPTEHAQLPPPGFIQPPQKKLITYEKDPTDTTGERRPGLRSRLGLHAIATRRYLLRGARPAAGYA